MRPSVIRSVVWLALLGGGTACGDDDTASDSDEHSQESQSNSNTASSGRGGSPSRNTGSGNAGRGSSASGGRSGSAGRTAPAADGGNPDQADDTPSGAAGASANAGAAGRRGSPTDRTTGTPPIAGASGSSSAAGSGTAGSGTAGSAAGSGGTTAPAPLTDPQITAVLGAANEGQVEVNTIAATKAIVPSVREYAEELVRAHTAAQQRLATVLTTDNIVPVENTYSTNLRNDTAEQVAALNAASTTDFEAGYLQAQIAHHEAVLQLIDDTLLRDVQNPSLRAELTALRAEVAGHLQLARELAADLEVGADAGVDAPTEDVDAGT